MTVQLEHEIAVVPPGEGDARWWFGQLAVMKATGASTGGLYTLVEITVGPGYRTPLHVHQREDEGFWVLDGHAAFTAGERTLDAPPGTYLYGPRNIPHWWQAGPDGARVLYLFTPAGIEGLIEEMSVPAAELVPPPRELAPPRNAPEIAQRFGCEILPMP
jgi:quercetin dioxygenase-like cupin family protein